MSYRCSICGEKRAGLYVKDEKVRRGPAGVQKGAVPNKVCDECYDAMTSTKRSGLRSVRTDLKVVSE